MKTVKSTSAAKSYALVLLALVLAVLFCKSFLPGYVHFSNDGPLGQQNAAWDKLPGAFAAAWADLNDIGGNAGSFPLGLSSLIRWVLGPVGYSKFLAPIALFILGTGAWCFFRQLKLSPLAATLGALAAALNSDFLATACWGVASQQIAIGMDFFALALVVSNTSATPVLTRWVRLALAGLCVGLNVMEAADIGAIFSLFVSAFILFKAIADESGTILVKAFRGIGRVALVAAFAGFIAVQTVVSLVSTQITGIAGTAQGAETKAAHWDWATQFSEPKIEALDLFVPGLFGYRMDTPNNMMEFLQKDYQGGNYWGAVGRDPAWDRYFAGGKQGPSPQGLMRFTGDGSNYAGILVALVAAWTIAQSLRRRDSVFSSVQQRLVWFWTAVLVVSLLMAFGRFGFLGGIPYRWLYALPYFHFSRNPTKFLYVFSWAIVILFAYGVHALQRRYMETPAGKIKSSVAQLQSWWKNVRGFDRKWAVGCVIAFAVSVLAWLIYASERANLVSYLQTVQFDEGMAKEIAAFSIGQAGWFLVFFAAAILLCIFTIAGIFSGPRARLGGILLGALLVVDLGRADLPYIIHWNYIQKYDIDPANHANSTNPIINLLRDKPYEHRVAILPFRMPEQFSLFEQLYQIEWTQHQFLYYDIQSLNIIQASRMASDLEAYESALAAHLTRRWELSNTRYLLGPAGFLDSMNEQLDPIQHRFRIVQRFNIVPKPGIAVPDGISPEQFAYYLQPDKITAFLNSDGDYALFEFTGALPRAKLYSNWQVSTNNPAVLQQWVDTVLTQIPGEWGNPFAGLNPTDLATLYTLASANFDPQTTVLLSAPLPAAASTNQNPGTVEFKSYSPKDIVLDANAATPSVLLLNDKYDPNWRVTVDDKPAELLRCNFIMRGVYLAPGAHTVEFKFSLPHRPLYITLAAIGVGILLCGFLFVSSRRAKSKTP